MEARGRKIGHLSVKNGRKACKGRGGGGKGFEKNSIIVDKEDTWRGCRGQGKDKTVLRDGGRQGERRSVFLEEMEFSKKGKGNGGKW